MPDAPRQWTLIAEERGEKRKRDEDVMPVTTCTECFSSYEATTATCPFCGHKAEPESRRSIEFVEGDLIELDPATLAAMRGEVEKIDGPVPPAGDGAPMTNSVFDDLVRLVENRSFGKARQMVVLGLGRSKRSEVVPLLIGLLDDDDVSGHAVKALAKLGAQDARPELERMVSDPRSWVRKEAQKALAKLG